MKYIILLSTLAACAAYPDNCYVHVYVPANDAGVESQDDAGLEPFDPEEARNIPVGVGTYGGNNETNRPATDSANR